MKEVVTKIDDLTKEEIISFVYNNFHFNLTSVFKCAVCGKGSKGDPDYWYQCKQCQVDLD